MIRSLLAIVFLLNTSLLSLSQQSHGTYEDNIPSTELSTFVNDVIRIRKDIQKFYNQCKNWDNGTIFSQLVTIEKLQEDIQKLAVKMDSRDKEIEKEFWETYNQCIRINNEVEFAKSVLMAKVEKEREWETTYFRLWEKILYKKGIVDQLYIEKQVNSGSKSIGYDRENTVIRKRRLYFAWNDAYDGFLIEMRRTQQYEQRIQIENKILTLFEKAEDLAFASTRDLEKELKNVEFPLEKYELIVNYIPDK